MKNVVIDNVSKRYGAMAAVDRVSLDIREGEIFFLLGPSGCGKTTLLRIIAGLTEPTSGKILIGGRDITRDPAHIRRTAMVFQNYALWPHMTVRENVQFAMAIRGEAKAAREARSRQALTIVHMQDFADRKPAQLSGGQQQRVALARAIAADPQCLLLDEPLSNLDANLRAEMRSEIRRICKQTGITTIYVTHDQKEALSVADRIAVMDRGRVEQVADPAELYGRPATKFIAGFVGETNFLAATVRRIDAGEVELEIGPFTLRSPHFPENLHTGDAVTASIRPERIRLATAPENSEGHACRAHTPNALSGRIRHVTFLGDLTQYDISLEGDLHLKVSEAAAARPAGEGESVTLTVAATDINVYPDRPE